MKALILMLALAATPAIAQTFQGQDPGMPRTVPFNDANGVAIGTATFAGNRIYLRSTAGVLVATIVVDKNGTQTMYDRNGNVLDKRELPK